MKIAIISDIHGNYEALRLFPETYDELWVLDDLVNFGPQPCEWVRSHAHCVVRGNHDHAVGYAADPRCIPAYQAMAAEIAAYSSSVLAEDQKRYLRLLLLTVERMIAGPGSISVMPYGRTRFLGGLDRDDPRWRREIDSTFADIVAVGHTHAPLLRSLHLERLVNSGSLGAFGATSPEASYATWEDWRLQLKRYSYCSRITVDEICKMPVSTAVQEQMIGLITTGDLVVGKA